MGHGSDIMRALSELHVDVYCLDGVPNNQPVPDVFFGCECEVDRGSGCNSLYSPRCRVGSSVGKSYACNQRKQ